MLRTECAVVHTLGALPGSSYLMRGCVLFKVLCPPRPLLNDHGKPKGKPKLFRIVFESSKRRRRQGLLGHPGAPGVRGVPSPGGRPRLPGAREHQLGARLRTAVLAALQAEVLEIRPVLTKEQAFAL